MNSKDKIKDRSGRILLWRLILGLYLIAVFCLSMIPSSSVSSVPDIPFMDKIAHFVMYAIMSILFVRAIKTERRKSMATLILIVIVSVAYGVLMELFQDYSGLGREFSPADILANAVGSIVGTIFYRTKHIFK